MTQAQAGSGVLREQQPGWLGGLALVPIYVFILLIIIFTFNNPGTVFEPPYLLPVLNVLLLAIVLFTVAYLAWRSYADSGQMSLFACRDSGHVPDIMYKKHTAEN